MTSEQGQDVLSGAVSEALEIHGMTPQEIRDVVDEELTGVVVVREGDSDHGE